MGEYAVPISCAGGVLFYIYCAWLAPDRDDPKAAPALLKNALGLFAFAAAFVLLFVLPWALYYGWSFAQVAAADLPNRFDSAVWAIYGALCAGFLALAHAGIAAVLTRSRQSQSQGG